MTWTSRGYAGAHPPPTPPPPHATCMPAQRAAVPRCRLINEHGMKVGVALKPGTGVEAVASVIALVDMVLVMTVEPGFGGQSFMPNMMPKVLSLRTDYPELNIQVDGGLGPNTIDEAAAAGANLIVAGSAVFKPGVDPSEPISRMRASVAKLGNGVSDDDAATKRAKKS